MFKRSILIIGVTSLITACSGVVEDKTLEEINKNNEMLHLATPSIGNNYCFDEVGNINEIGAVRTVENQNYFCSELRHGTWIKEVYTRKY